MTNKGRKRRLFWIFAVVLVAAVLYGADLLFRLSRRPPSGPLRITVSKETTHILGPVNKDGTVNYVAYLNAKHSKGVTKANNAAIPLIEIFGPDLLPEDTGPEICKILKIELPSKGEKYFITLEDYLEKTLSKADANAWLEREEDPTIAKPTPWKAEQYPAAAEWLKTNNDALDAMLIAMRRTEYYLPMVSSGTNECMAYISLPALQACRNMGEALVARAMLKLDSGDTPGAWADLMAARHLARRIGSGCTLVENLVALAIEANACSASRAMAGSGKLTGAQARALLAEMQRLGPLPDIADNVDQTERFFMLDIVMTLARASRKENPDEALRGLIPSEQLPGRTNWGAVEWDKILVRMNPWYDSFAAAARQKTFKARTKALAAHDRRAEEFAAKVSKPRSFLQSILGRSGDPTETMGNVLITMFIPAISRAVVLRDRATAQGELSVVAMALAAYRAEKKAYPEKLSQLSPGYLKKVPDDLFIDKPFGYKRTGKGYLLYSVGENMKYEVWKKDDDNDDIVVELK